MWNKPWRLTEGFLIGLGLIITGLILQLCVAPVNWSAFKWPANIISLTIFLCINSCIYLLSKKVYAFRYMRTYTAAIPALIYTVLLTIFMGFIPQTSSNTTSHADFLGLTRMLSFWPFVLIYTYIVLILGQTIIHRFLHFKHWSDILFILNHLGLFLALTAATLGNADMQQLKMVTASNEPEWRALNGRNDVVELPFAIELKQFIMEEYDDLSPKRFASDIQIYTKSGKSISATVDVNKPVRIEGWNVYQYGYDTAMGAGSNISILQLVRDPWLPVVYMGIIMMLLGAVCMFILPQRRET